MKTEVAIQRIGRSSICLPRIIVTVANAGTASAPVDVGRVISACAGTGCVERPIAKPIIKMIRTAANAKPRCLDCDVAMIELSLRLVVRGSPPLTPAAGLAPHGTRSCRLQ